MMDRHGAQCHRDIGVQGLVNDAWFVIATNRWAAALEELAKEGREWLQASQVYVQVGQPLKVQDDDQF